jgi:ribosome assembly protein SQT1
LSILSFLESLPRQDFGVEMSASRPTQNPPTEEYAEDLLTAEDAAEEIDPDGDDPMEDDDAAEDEVQEEIQFQNDSAAHFDTHTDSIFCIAQHPLNPSLIVTGGGDDVAFLFDSSLKDHEPGPLLPPSYESNPQPKAERKSIPPLQKLDGHTDSVNAVAFTHPSGEYVVTAGLDGKLRAWSSSSIPPSSSPVTPTYTFLSESAEVQEINWVSPCPSPLHPNTIALGASDGSVWVYTVSSTDPATALTITQAYYLHTESCTAGTWTPDGELLATVSEDSSLQVYDVWGEAAAAGIASAGSGSGQALISLTASDQRFNVQGGLYSIAISPGGTIAAVGGAGGNIRIVGLPRLGVARGSEDPGLKGGGAKNKTGGARNAVTPSSSTTTATSTTGIGQSGALLASLQCQSDGVETLSFSAPPLTLLAAGSVDGSIALFDVAHRFAPRRLIGDAHDGFAVVQVEFVGERDADPGSARRSSSSSHYLTSAGMDGVVRRWDCRGSTVPGPGQAVAEKQGQGQGQGFVKEWRGHRGDGEGGGVLAFVQGGGAGEEEKIVTAGDDGVALVFRAGLA